MSRIDLAWQRASGAVIDDAAIAAGAERPVEADEGVLQRYPPESGRSGPSRLAPESPDQKPHRTIVPPRTVDVPSRTVERRQFAPLQAALDRKLVVSERATPIAVVQYRRLAGALHQLQIERGLKTLMVTSALPNDGRTLTVANLALTLSGFFSRRVLLIDGDLRRPSIHTLFRLPNACGLSDLLLSERDDIPLLQVSGTLSVLPAGRPGSNTMAALTSDRMEDLVAELATQFDWILLDAAPVGFMPDAQLLARMTGAVLFVIGAGSTQSPDVDRAIAALGPEHVVGTVLNRVVDDNIPASSYFAEPDGNLMSQKTDTCA